MNLASMPLPSFLTMRDERTAARRRAHRTMAAGCVGAAVLVGLAGAALAAQLPRTCANTDALGVSRVAEIDAGKGQVYGGITQAPTNDILKPKEVVLTFDDGPYEGLSRRILDALDHHCTRATFFVVGQMALARPEIVREEIARGHTVGTHPGSHPMPMKALTPEAQIEEIDKGIAAASRVAGKGLAPFFRFPGLGDSPETLAHLKSRGIATFTVDIISNDSFIADPAKLAEHTVNILEKKGKGILLFHDIKPSTAAALPAILDHLKRGGYRIVHLVPKGQGLRPATAAVRGPASPAMTGGGAERLPWGLAHPGPIPTILPSPSKAGSVAGPSPPASTQAAPPLLPRAVQPQPPAPNADWETSVFGTTDKS